MLNYRKPPGLVLYERSGSHRWFYFLFATSFVFRVDVILFVLFLRFFFFFFLCVRQTTKKLCFNFMFTVDLTLLSRIRIHMNSSVYENRKSKEKAALCIGRAHTTCFWGTNAQDLWNEFMWGVSASERTRSCRTRFLLFLCLNCVIIGKSSIRSRMAAWMWVICTSPWFKYHASYYLRSRYVRVMKWRHVKRTHHVAILTIDVWVLSDCFQAKHRCADILMQFECFCCSEFHFLRSLSLVSFALCVLSCETF